MSSIEIIKQELLNQKNILEQKGVSVNVTNTNPSPSDITAALQTLPEQSGGINLTSLALSIITGTGTQEIYIPEDAPSIKPYAYYSYGINNDTLFNKHNLRFPDTVASIGANAFRGANITGTLTIPATCANIGTNAFQYSKISEAIILTDIPSTSSYLFSNCSNLKKAVMAEGVSCLPNQLFGQCIALEEVYLPSSVSAVYSTAFYQSTAIKLIKFAGATPFSLATGTFKYCENAIFLVPYQSYDAYWNATNYRLYNQDQYGYGEFNTGDNLPSSIDGYTIVWYPSLEDAKAEVNAITACPSTGTMYARFTSVA